MEKSMNSVDGRSHSVTRKDKCFSVLSVPSVVKPFFKNCLIDHRYLPPAAGGAPGSVTFKI
jgi:hypothetical protein